MAKHYRVKKDTPAWLRGAILKQNDPDTVGKVGSYAAISDLWDTFEENYPSSYVEYGEVVENTPQWFERVYETKVLSKVKYLTKEAARKMHNEIYKER